MAGISSVCAGKYINKLKFTSKEEQTKEFSDGNGLEWLDYGARMYDVQVARWHTIDPMSEEGYSLTPYRFCYNNPVNIIDPNGKLEISDEFKKNYPEVANFLQTLTEYYKGKQNDIFNFSDDFKAAFKEWSTLSDVDIDEFLKFGEGPSLDVWDLDGMLKNQGDGANGFTQTEIFLDESGNPVNLIGSTPNAQKNGTKGNIILDDNIVKTFEAALNGNFSREDFEKATNAFVSTLFHEGTHYGRFKNKTSRLGETTNDKGKIIAKEYGQLFEEDKRTFGINISRFSPDLHQNTTTPRFKPKN